MTWQLLEATNILELRMAASAGLEITWRLPHSMDGLQTALCTAYMIKTRPAVGCQSWNNDLLIYIQGFSAKECIMGCSAFCRWPIIKLPLPGQPRYEWYKIIDISWCQQLFFYILHVMPMIATSDCSWQLHACWMFCWFVISTSIRIKFDSIERRWEVQGRRFDFFLPWKIPSWRNFVIPDVTWYWFLCLFERVL